jgi:hypothetical protein
VNNEFKTITANKFYVFRFLFGHVESKRQVKPERQIAQLLQIDRHNPLNTALSQRVFFPKSSMADLKPATIADQEPEMEGTNPQNDQLEEAQDAHQDAQNSHRNRDHSDGSDHDDADDSQDDKSAAAAIAQANTPNNPENDQALTPEQSEQYGPDANPSGDSATEENAWVPTWDDESQAYYWWNTVTNETTWENPYPDLAQGEDDSEQAYYGEDQQDTAGYHAAEAYYAETSNPLDAVLNKIDTEVRAQLDNTTDTSKPFQSYNELFDRSEITPQAPMHSYDSVAHFNARTGKFTSSKEADRLNPEYMSLESRAKRQMQYYFDVDAYQEQRNRERLEDAAGKKRPLSKKEVEKFKRQKQEKKEKRKRDWLSKDYD